MNIFVGNLGYDDTAINPDDPASFQIGEEDVREMFQDFGTVDSVRLVVEYVKGKAKAFAIVEMPDDAEGKKAIQKLHGKTVKGRAIQVNESAAVVSAKGLLLTK